MKKKHAIEVCEKKRRRARLGEQKGRTHIPFSDISNSRSFLFSLSFSMPSLPCTHTLFRSTALPRSRSLQRRFIVTEALFQAEGSLCPLDGVVALKKQFGYRLILDETQSFGSVGRTGRGLTEHCDVAVRDVDILVVTLEGCLASVRSRRASVYFWVVCFKPNAIDISPTSCCCFFIERNIQPETTINRLNQTRHMNTRVYLHVCCGVA